MRVRRWRNRFVCAVLTGLTRKVIQMSLRVVAHVQAADRTRDELARVTLTLSRERS